MNTKDFIDKLNAEKFGSFKDWRIPTINELLSIVNYGLYDPPIDYVYFPYSITLCDFYLTSTAIVRSNTNWGIYYSDGKPHKKVLRVQYSK
ncbi:MAG: DUF1566 domain-containing protein [Desulfamplus sp.]|nr:DUF1566 domain-containing protein [Desulfamplus sp.]